MTEHLSKTTKLIVEIHFNDWGGTPERTTRNWIEKRLALFMTYTRKSLQLQTSQNFSCYVIYDPASEHIIREVLKRYAPLPANIQFVTPRDYYAHVAEDVAGYERYYRVYLSSDDMYHKDFIRKLQAYTPKKNTAALVPQYGYIYDSVQHRMGKFFFWLPSYGATIHDVGTFLRGQKPSFSWRDALKVPHEFIHVKEPIWINHLHALNTGTTFERVSAWKLPGITDAMTLEPWNDSQRSKTFFGPEIENPIEIKRVLSNFF
ncbi:MULTISPECIES: glycosyltransferase [Paenibacillus]|uniref:glycosyltransferase n=1 Tax=Paenibacillus TaxID=44249 RepID=UPI00073F9D28|nr:MULTISPECIES: glycosyltransferase [Paenibacillus]MDU4694684.1 glycosyltransferase [Paenibacillus sp.]